MDTILYKKFESWPEPVKPPFAEIKVIGCCGEHEQLGDFKWYRERTWQDFRDIILFENLLRQEFDPFDFTTMDPRVHRYYLKGALSAIAKIVEKIKNFDELEFDVWLWITRDEKDVEKLLAWDGQNSEFSKEEVSNIIELVEEISNLKAEDSDKQEITTTLTYWKTLHTMIK